MFTPPASAGAAGGHRGQGATPPPIPPAKTASARRRSCCLAASFRVSEKDVRDRPTARVAAASATVVAAPAERAAERTPRPEPQHDSAPWQRELLEILPCSPEYVNTAQAEIRPEDLAYEPCRQIYRTCCELSDGGVTPTFERLMLAFDQPLKSLLVELDETGRAKQMASPQEVLEAFFVTFRRRRIVQPTPGQQEDEQLFKLARELRARHGISPPTDG